MKEKSRMRRSSLKHPGRLCFLCLAATSWVLAGDWPQWRGPERSGLSRETGLLREWPQGGPPVVWSIANLGEGYGAIALAGNRIYVQGGRSNESVVHCLAASDGKTLWTTSLGRSARHERGNGPRGTPTVDGDRIYALSENGDLGCLDAKTGAVSWKLNILKQFGGSGPEWLISESPLVDGGRLIVTPGGRQAGIVALNKTDGRTLWTSKELSDGAGYSSCLAVDVQGIRTILGFTEAAAVGVRAADGKLLWRYEKVANRTANIATPVFFDDRVFYTSAYGTGAALLALKRSGDSIAAEEVYFTREMMNHHGGVVLVEGHIYGFSGSILTCVDVATGKSVWKDRSVGKGSLTYADGRLYLLGEGNVVGLAEATSAGYREKGRFNIPDQGWASWAHPVVCGGKLFIRNQGTLTCYNVKAPARS
jgi:outer membrane protein assembly factor BamB